MKRRVAAKGTADNRASVLIRVSLDDIYGGMIAERTGQDETLAALAASIARHGLLQPVLLRRSAQHGRYAIVCGARRVAACRLLGLREIDALLLDADAQKAAVCFMEEQLTHCAPGALAMARAMQAAGGRELLEETALERAQLAQYLELLSLPESVCRVIGEYRLSAGQARPLLRVKGEERQLEAALIIAERALTPAQARRLVCGPQRQRQEEPCGRRRAVRLALEEVSRVAQAARLRGVDASVRVHSLEGGMCVQIHFAHGEKRASQQEFADFPRIH